MAWTSPMTFTANTVLTAAQLNTHLRDNLLETAPAKATQAGSLFIGAGPNKIEERIPKAHRVAASESTKVTEYRSLGTMGPKVVVSTGTKALVFLAANVGSTATDQASYMSYAISGATSKDPSDNTALLVEGVHGGKSPRWCHTAWEEDLKPGLNTFTCKYKSGKDESNSTFFNRFIAVWPF